MWKGYISLAVNSDFVPNFWDYSRFCPKVIVFINSMYTEFLFSVEFPRICETIVPDFVFSDSGTVRRNEILGAAAQL